ncbi:MAG: hypothetical protein AMJ46_08785 [Latescibacteria bacterium DG_63]|nr:MAG: hypothetical protein AMJ46_08785 [Latescibacteria bacterium DG_63]
MHRETKKDWYVAIGVFVITLAVYIETLALTTPFWDGGEFVAVSYILGVPHPPGTPLYTLIGRFFTVFPFASVATRVNFISALSSALAVLFTFLVTVRLAKMTFRVQEWKAWLAGLVSSFLMAFSNTFWWNGTEAEVYSLSSFVMVLTFWMALRWWEVLGKDHSDRMLLLIAYVLSLCVGIHLGTLLVAPGILVLILLVDWRTLLKPRLVALVVGLFILGVSVHLYLLLRANLDPAINEASPKTWDDLWLVLKRDQYKPGSIFVRRAEFSFQVGMFWRYFSNQFTLWGGRFETLGRYIPILLGIVGGYFHAIGNRKTFAALFTVFIVCSLGLIIYLNFTDHEVRERDYFYVAAYHFFAIWMGIGAVGLLQRFLHATRKYLKNQRILTVGFSSLLILVSVLPFFHFHYSHDRTEDSIARNFAYNMLVPLEKDAILLTNGDNDTFPLWYIQEVEGVRKDVRVANLSLMRTHWYLKQMKNNPPKIPLTLSDYQIDALTPYRDQDGKVWQVNRIAVYDIIQANKWQRPLYLAVTVPDQMDLERRLILEGLVFRIAPDEVGLRLDEAKMQANLYEIFNWDGIIKPDGTTDDSFYKDISSTKLIQNYAAAHFTFAFWHRQHGRHEQATKEMERSHQISPQFKDATRWLGQFYLESGELDKAEQHYLTLLDEYPADPEIHYQLGVVHMEMERWDDAIANFRRAIELNRSFQHAYYALADTYAGLGKWAEREAVLRAWLQIRPDDARARSSLEALRGQE